MRTALIVPESLVISKNKLEIYKWDQMREFKSRKRLWSCPSLSLLTAAAMLPNDFLIDYIDLNYRNRIPEKYDAVFLSPSTSQVNHAYEIADSMRKQGTIVVMGGPHVSFLPEESLKHSDCVFVGEAEDTFNTFLQDLAKGNIKPIYMSQTYPDLKLSPIPRYDLVRMYPYKSIPVQTSRGCPHQCSFCISSKLYGEKFRRKPVEQVCKELDIIKSIWERPFIFFTDDNMFINSEYILELLDYLKKLKIRWYAFSDARVVEKPGLLKKMAESGCTQLLIGFESLSAENLIQINESKWKMRKLMNYRHIISEIQGYGIGVVGSFVLGLEEDTINVFEDLYNFVERTNLYATNITILTPFPGTKLYQMLQEENRIINDDWSKYNGFELNFIPKNIPISEFEEQFLQLYRKLDSEERINSIINYFKAIFSKKVQKLE